MGQFFICHSSTDGREAMALAVALEGRGRSCWIAPRNIGAGTNYPHEIVEGIKRCPEFIIVLSEAAVRSDHILRELEMAVNQRKKIIPLRLAGVTLSNAVSYLLASVQWIEVSEDEWEKAPGSVADQILGGAGSRLAYQPAKSRGKGLWIGAIAAGIAVLAAAGCGWAAGWFGPRSAASPVSLPLVEQETVKIVPSNPPHLAEGTSQRLAGEAAPLRADVEPEVPPVVEAPVVVFPEGEWRCKGKAAYEIEWGMRFTRDGEQLLASGAKTMVDGKPATKGERQTTLELRGRLNGTDWEGRYIEASKKTTAGDFKIRFSDDMKSFSGQIFTPDKKASSAFEGAKR